MNIIITYFTNPQESTILRLNVEPTTLIQTFTEYLSQQIGHKILLIPMSLSSTPDQSLAEYYEHIPVIFQNACIEQKKGSFFAA